LLFEVDRTRAFDVGEVLPAEGNSFLSEIRRRSYAGHRLHHRPDLFGEVLVGHAEYGRVGDRGMGGECNNDAKTKCDQRRMRSAPRKRRA
jgi:hypothetical protein